MLRRTAFLCAMLAIGSWLALAGLAAAQTIAAVPPQAPRIDLTPLIIQAIGDVLTPIVAAVATYLINAHVKNRELAQILSNAVQNGIGVVQKAAVQELTAKPITFKSTGDEMLDQGVRYVLENAKEAVEHFNIPPERIAEKLVAKLGLANIATNLATTASPSPVVANPLAAVPAGVSPLT